MRGAHEEAFTRGNAPRALEEVRLLGGEHAGEQTICEMLRGS